MTHDAAFPVAIVTSALILVLGSSLLFATRSWLSLLSELADHPHRLLIPGLATVVFGLIVVFNHNVWSGGWVVVITAAGWLILLKGLALLFGPKIVVIHKGFPEPVIKLAMRAGGVILILLAIMLLLTLTGRA